jgi:hypothetical protein
MVLPDEISLLSRRSLRALDAAHDYFAFTAHVWRLLQKDIYGGRRFRLQNKTTGTKISERTFVESSEVYVNSYLLSSTFQHFVSLFEDFFFDFLRLWLIAYPGSLSRKQLEFATVLKAPDKNAIVALMVERELNELKYERVADWFAYLNRLAKLDCPTSGAIGQIAEMKAARDLLVHNKGIVNATYLDKAATFARWKLGEQMELAEPYHRECWTVLKKIIGDLASSAIEKTKATV